MKHITPFTKIIAGFGILVILISLVVYYTGRYSPLATPTFENAGSTELSMTSSLAIIFSQEMEQKSVQARIISTPSVPFSYNWEGRKLTLSPKMAFTPGDKVTIELQAGSNSMDGRQYLKGLQWSFRVRKPRIIYLGQPTTSPEIWISEPDGNLAHPLTNTGGKITGFFPFHDGSAILFTKKNDQGGADIVFTNANGTGERIILNCGKEICRDVVIDTAGVKIAFSRNQNPLNSEPSKNYYIYTLDLVSGTVLPLYPEGVIQGVSPNWSPDGKKIAFYDQNSLGIRIRDFYGANDFLLGTVREQTGSWSPDSNKFIFVDDITDNGLAYSNLYQVDLQSSSVAQPLKDTNGTEEYGSPAWSPDGKTVVMGTRQINAEVTKQLWLFDLEMNSRTAITTASAFTNAAPQWRPDGKALVFQQAQLGSSGNKPGVIAWDSVQNTFKTITSDGALPAWLP